MNSFLKWPKWLIKLSSFRNVGLLMLANLSSESFSYANAVMFELIEFNNSLPGMIEPCGVYFGEAFFPRLYVTVEWIESIFPSRPFSLFLMMRVICLAQLSYELRLAELRKICPPAVCLRLRLA